MKVKNLPHLFTLNQLLVEFTQFLIALYNLIILERPTLLLIDACVYAQAGLNYTLKYIF